MMSPHFSAQFHQDSLIEVERFVRSIFIGDEFSKRYFHNIQHTEMVVGATKLLCTSMNVSKADQLALHIAAWFHDVGYVKGSVNHEVESVNIATTYLNRTNETPSLIEVVSNLILSTKIPTNPDSPLEEIICDADMYHMTSDLYAEWSYKLKLEIEAEKKMIIPTEKWKEENLIFFNKHRFYSPYAKSNWTSYKLNNLRLLQES